ncbi:MAG: hypothetical protein GYB33_05755 [Gammaproteobacteria bacterium]|uniref:ubiquinone biosynthesis accessory factor UbiJ n=1 Tax=Pseudomaricurvus alcaniphilus TaxID=1166482 RepID=UPI0014084CF0|nr:SCP2 sterol-binding domain-containing protein [Pseudomaricurvus alcaniphilus]MBR9909842.1 hypothetical protein [Gammaproteobacteria bacterium]NHN38568.1 hypothetical protein [Pseudomaricurvus alcaniphilus]
MIDPTLISAATATLEAAIDKALRYDPATRQRLQQLAGKSLAIELTELQLTLGVYFEEQGIALSTHIEEPSTRLKGSLPALLLIARDPGTSLAQAGVEAEGDTSVLLAVRDIGSDLELDWEEALNDWLGDVAGHQLAQVLRGQVNWLRERANSGRRLVGEFLTEELRAVPSPSELQHFSEQVDQLRLASDRLQARFDRLRDLLSNSGSA